VYKHLHRYCIQQYTDSWPPYKGARLGPI
jgi:hypothetical protein